jgi:hypothetical protein
MALNFNGVDGFLEYAGQLVGSYPCTMIVWGTRASSTNDQNWISQSQSNAFYALRGFQKTSSEGKGISIFIPGDGDTTLKTTTPNVSATVFKLMVVVFNSAANRTIYFGDSTSSVNSPANKAGGLSTYNLCNVGALRFNSAAAVDFVNGSLAEAHWFNVALASTDVANLVADTVKPEAVSGWVDGWTFKDYQSSGNYVSIGGARTMVASGGVTASGLAHPITRTAAAPAATIAWTEGAEVFALAGSVVVSGIAVAAAWTEGAETTAIAGTVSAAMGTITTRIIKNNTGLARTSLANCAINIYNATTGALVLRSTGLTSNSTGRLVVTNAAIVAGTSYAYEIDLTAASMGRRLPLALAA